LLYSQKRRGRERKILQRSPCPKRIRNSRGKKRGKKSPRIQSGSKEGGRREGDAAAQESKNRNCGSIRSLEAIAGREKGGKGGLKPKQYSQSEGRGGKRKKERNEKERGQSQPVLLYCFVWVKEKERRKNCLYYFFVIRQGQKEKVSGFCSRGSEGREPALIRRREGRRGGRASPDHVFLFKEGGERRSSKGFG